MLENLGVLTLTMLGVAGTVLTIRIILAIFEIQSAVKRIENLFESKKEEQ